MPRGKPGAGHYQDMVGVLEAELCGVEDVFAGLTAAEWAVATELVPFDPGQPRWTLFELAGHFDISIGLTRMLIADPQPGLPECDGVSFFIFSRAEVAPELYDYAYTMVEGKTPAQMPAVLHETFTKTVQEARAAPPGIISPFPGFEPYPLMRLDEFVLTRIVEAVVHGMDLTDALGRPAVATPDGIAATASLLDELLARRAVPGRPAGLGDDVAWVRAASGRDQHPDPRLPLIV
jgi:hypothetical protein